MSDKELTKSLRLFDVYAIATGAMFSSGFFLLPGIAAAQAGPSVYLAYFAAGILIIPAMFCMAELSTAMPKAGGTYYFLDRSLGPMVGTIGGLGSWIAVVFKSAFALVGMGAYLSLYIDVPITALAVILTVVFGLVNIFGAKETTLLQRVLVGTLVVILAAFVIKGLVVVGVPDAFFPRQSYDVFFKNGFVGFLGVVGLVFVSYAGLTKVASVAEEVENPDRNIPLGMFLSLITATAVYTLGLMVMINVLTPDELYKSLTPVADAGEKFLGFLPYDLGIILIVVAAIAAFASTGNAGIMSASRYPFAMAKDGLVPEKFGKIGKFGTPVKSIMLTVGVMIAVLILFDVKSVAKLASAFQLLLFGMVCLAVVVMRESHIESYKPGFKCPLYPWVPVAGILVSFWLIVEMGALAIGFTGMVIVVCVLWYFFYAFEKVNRGGALLHVQARMDLEPHEPLEEELMGIVEERTANEEVHYKDLITRSVIVNCDDGYTSFEDIQAQVFEELKEHSDLSNDGIPEGFIQQLQRKELAKPELALWHGSLSAVEEPFLIIFNATADERLAAPDGDHYDTLFFLISPEKPAGLDLRLTRELSEAIESRWSGNDWSKKLSRKDTEDELMRDADMVKCSAEDSDFLNGSIGLQIQDIALPDTCTIVLIERNERTFLPSPDSQLKSRDRVTIIGEARELKIIRRKSEERNSDQEGQNSKE